MQNFVWNFNFNFIKAQKAKDEAEKEAKRLEAEGKVVIVNKSY